MTKKFKCSPFHQSPLMIHSQGARWGISLQQIVFVILDAHEKDEWDFFCNGFDHFPERFSGQCAEIALFAVHHLSIDNGLRSRDFLKMARTKSVSFFVFIFLHLLGWVCPTAQICTIIIDLDVFRKGRVSLMIVVFGYFQTHLYHWPK